MRLLREWVRIILEGYKEDQEILIKKFPDSQNEIVRMNPKMISWFIRRFGNNPSVKEIHPFEDCITTIQKYDKKAAGLGQKYNTNQFFKSLVNEKIPDKKWSNLADYANMTVDQMEKIMGLSERKKPRFEIEGNESDLSDYLGKFGPWNLWMPTTRENSTKIAGYDPETLEPKTTWCTARVTDSNLFYNYASEGIILYYIIKDNPKVDTDWLSVGFVDGEPVLEGKDGDVTIDRDNKGLTEEKLKSILGGYYQQLMTAMQEKTDKIGGEHPAKKKFEEAAESLSAYQNLIKGLGKEESVDLKLVILRQKNVSPEILIVLADDEDEYVIEEVAANPFTPSHILEKLSDDEDLNVRENVAWNPSTPVHILEKLSDDKKSYVRENVARNPSTPVHILEKLSDDEDEFVARIAQEEILRIKRAQQLAELKRLIRGLI